jgi:SAM-dependent methyltransferase
MELLNAEAEKLRTLVHDWYTHPEQELEATFGSRGQVSLTEFLRISQRLRGKGFRAEPQEDKLNIILPEKLRFTLTGLGMIQQYCRDDSLADKPFTAMIKDRTAIESTIDMNEYDMRVKSRREIDVDPEEGQVRGALSQWAQQKKAFRLIRRWTYFAKGFRIDMSMIRSTAKDQRGAYRWQQRFTDQPITKSAAFYEVEVELIRDEIASEEEAMKLLIGGCGEVLRGIQNHTMLIRKNKKTRVLDAYKALIKSDRFRGVNPVTLEVVNISATLDPIIPNVRTGYNVTEKADGLRVLGFCDERGELYMLDMSLNVYRTGLMKEELAGSLVDGEWVTRDKENKPVQMLLLFDIYNRPGGESVAEMPFFDVRGGEGAGAAEAPVRFGRWFELQNWLKGWAAGEGPRGPAAAASARVKLQVTGKEFVFAGAGDNRIFTAAAQVLDKNFAYHTDGLIFTPNKAPLPGPGDTFMAQFKWKPASENTIDFLATFEKDLIALTADRVMVGEKPGTGQTVRYKTMRLHVASRNDPATQNPREALLFEQLEEDSIAVKPGAKPKPKTRPVMFTPQDYPDQMASFMNRETEPADVNSLEEFIITEVSQEPIMDKSIVECRYDASQEPGWRWIPIRIRHDKTERFQKGIIERTMNAERTANNIWNSIHNPVTESMIRPPGLEEPAEGDYAQAEAGDAEGAGEEKKYYDRKMSAKDEELTKSMRNFHNRYIKEDILLKRILKGNGKTLLDVACGKAGDLQKWRNSRVSFVLGVDYSMDNITNKKDGAYRRYVDLLTSSKRARELMPRMVFAVGDSSRPLITGEAAPTPQDSDILRAVFGRMAPDGQLPPYIEKSAAGELRQGADAVVCMFALHYFFESAAKFQGLLENIRDTLKVGGYFAGACPDGEKMFNLLRATKKGDAKVGAIGDSIIWTYRKEYEAEALPKDDTAFGLAVDMEFVSIGTQNREYLVPFPFLVEKMKTIGCELLTPAECAELGLRESSNLFEKSHEMATKAGQKYPMNDVVKQFSFLNRWFIFRRRGTGQGVAEVAAVAAATEAAQKGVPNLASGMEFNPFADEGAGLGAGAAKPSTVVLGASMPPLPRGSLAAALAAPGGGGGGSEAALFGASGAGGMGLGQEGVASDQLRTVPIEVSTAKVFKPNEVFTISPEASMLDREKTGVEAPGRYLHNFAPFPIQDPSDPSIEYPSVEHFMAAMHYKLATNKPDMAVALFSRGGDIHRQFNERRLIQTATSKKPLSKEDDWALVKEEMAAVLTALSPGAFKRYGAVFDESKWLVQKDAMLRMALEQRYARDAKFRQIVDALKAKGKYLLNYVKSPTNELGGQLSKEGKIVGANKVGKLIMEIANFAPFI